MRPIRLNPCRTGGGAHPARRRHLGRLSGGDADFARARRSDRIEAAALCIRRYDAFGLLDDGGRPRDRRAFGQRIRLAVDLHDQCAAGADCRAVDPDLDAARSCAGAHLRPADERHRSRRHRSVRGVSAEPDGVFDEPEKRAALACFGGFGRLWRRAGLALAAAATTVPRRAHAGAQLAAHHDLSARGGDLDHRVQRLLRLRPMAAERGRLFQRRGRTGDAADVGRGGSRFADRRAHQRTAQPVPCQRRRGARRQRGPAVRGRRKPAVDDRHGDHALRRHARHVQHRDASGRLHPGSGRGDRHGRRTATDGAIYRRHRAASLLASIYGEHASDHGLHSLAAVAGALSAILFIVTLFDRTLSRVVSPAAAEGDAPAPLHQGNNYAAHQTRRHARPWS